VILVLKISLCKPAAQKAVSFGQLAASIAEKATAPAWTGELVRVDTEIAAVCFVVQPVVRFNGNQ